MRVASLVARAQAQAGMARLRVVSGDRVETDSDAGRNGRTQHQIASESIPTHDPSSTQIRFSRTGGRIEQLE
jgi:hypothetical protein